MESESSLPYSQQSENENYPEPHEVKPQHNTLSFNRHYMYKNNYGIISQTPFLREDIYIFLQSRVETNFTSELIL